MWKVEISPKTHIVSVTNGIERINFGRGKLNEFGRGKSQTDQKHLDLAFLVRDALNEHEKNHKETGL